MYTDDDHDDLLRQICNQEDSNQTIMESWEVQRLDELSALVAGLAGRDDIKLQFGSRWAWSATQKTVLLPKEDLHDLHRCRAIASHEVGHVLFTRHMSQLNIAAEFKHIPQIFLHTMHNVYEDPRIEVAVGKIYPGAEHWLRELHQIEETEAEGEALKDAPIPAAMQFFFAHIREYHRDWKPLSDTEIDPVLIPMLEETRADRIAMSEMLPECIREEGEDLDAACISEVDIRYREATSNSALLGSVEQKKKLSQARMMSLMEGKTREYAFALYELDALRIEMAMQDMDSADRLDPYKVFQKAFGSPLDVDPNLLEGQQAGHKAQEMLREWYERQRVVHGVSTESDFRNAKCKKTDEGNGRRRRRGRRGDSESDQTQSLLRTYDEMRQKVADQIQKMTQELQNVLRPTKAAKWKDGYSSGSKVNLRRMLQREARNQGDLDFWQRKTEVSKRDVAATLLIDLSGSMQGKKSEAALQGAILFWESLHALGISASISGFKRTRIPILGFGEPIVQANRKKIANMLNLVGSVNHDADAVQSAFEELIRQPVDQHVLIVISDGQPVGENAEQRLLQTIEQVQKRVHLVGLGLGEDTRHVEQFYPHAKGEIPVFELARQIGSVMQKVLRRY